MSRKSTIPVMHVDSILSASWLFFSLKQRHPFKSVQPQSCRETCSGSWLHNQNGDFLNKSATLKSEFFNSFGVCILYCINEICFGRNSETRASKGWIFHKGVARNLTNGALILWIVALKRNWTAKSSTNKIGRIL